MAREITYNNFEISLVVFMPNITTNHAITYTNFRLNFNYFWIENEVKVKRTIIFFFIELEIDSSFFFLFSIQNKTFLLRNENKNKSEIKAEVKLIWFTAGGLNLTNGRFSATIVSVKHRLLTIVFTMQMSRWQQ